MSRAAVEPVVREVVSSAMKIDAQALPLDTPLGDGGLGFDSIGCLELLLDIEGRLGVRLRTEELRAESLASLGSLIDYIAGVRGR